MSPEQWLFAAFGVAVTLLNFMFSSGRWAGTTDASLRSSVAHLRELLTIESAQRQQGDAQLQQSIAHIDRLMTQLDERRHDMRGELVSQQATYWQEVGRRIDKSDTEMTKRFDAVDRRLQAIEQRTTARHQ